jgi:hypothetical protein
MIYGLAFGQISTSCPEICARWYFNRVIPPLISFPHNLQFNLCLLNPPSGSPYSHIGSKFLGIFSLQSSNFRIQIAMIKPRAQKKFLKKIKINIEESKYKNVA